MYFFSILIFQFKKPISSQPKIERNKASCSPRKPKRVEQTATNTSLDPSPLTQKELFLMWSFDCLITFSGFN